MAQEVEHVDVHVEVNGHPADAHATVGHHGAATEQGVLASLGLDAQLFVFQLVNFAIVGAIVWFMILKPLTKAMDERKKVIDESLDNAKKIDANLQISQQKYQEKIDEAKVEANKLIEKAHAEASQLGDKMKEKAKNDIELLIAQAKKNIEIEKQDAMEAVRKEAGKLIVAATEKIVTTKLDEKEDKKVIEGAVKILEDQQ